MGTSNKPFASVLLICAILAVLVSLSASSSVVGFVGDHHQMGFFPMQSGCSGSIAECFGNGSGELFDDEVEFQMTSESTRRILATTRYISYGALRRNSVPCSRRGASYYNCRPGGQANPYTRGCSAITRCRR
ncbi:LOW QUALITY PROTEIN: protein RALF-like 33 [Carica papaya]|uniref:LOW QUALITY PROTEIN: protein RALF-like 33 n=1 Tax=Carica papaya TaxID=3649 RepID=UPI000B8CD866|nr:LOW QUALITY PROTEIN: protein RALF-like 33 [Carica papaya]